MNVHELFFEHASDEAVFIDTVDDWAVIDSVIIREELDIGDEHWQLMSELDETSVVGQACILLIRTVKRFEDLTLDLGQININGKPLWVQVYQQMMTYMFG